MSKKRNKIIAVVLSVAIINGVYQEVSKKAELYYQRPYSLEKVETTDNINNNITPSTNTKSRRRKRFFRNSYQEKDERY